MEQFWLGVMTTLWAVTVGGVGYVLWRYVYKPWAVVREDIARLALELQNVRNDIGLRKAMQLDDADLAIAEARDRVRKTFR